MESIMNVLRSSVTLLAAVLCIVSASALAGFEYGGWRGAQVGNATPPGYAPGNMDALDLADALTVNEEYPGEGEDEPGFGEWGPKDAGAAKPGLGFPGSGVRPPKVRPPIED
jgi:hypothetical protein